MSFFNKIKNTPRNIWIRNSFLIPIFLVVIMSISHVISWYNLGNPISWAIYLSIAIEVFALVSVAAVSIRIGKTAVWILFGLVTSIQILGNIFFTFQEIDISSEFFINWIELIKPFFEDWNIVDHKRFLAIIQGGTLPVMSLIALHFFIKFNDKDEKIKVSAEPEKSIKSEAPINDEKIEEKEDIESVLDELEDNKTEKEDVEDVSLLDEVDILLDKYSSDEEETKESDDESEISNNIVQYIKDNTNKNKRNHKKTKDDNDRFNNPSKMSL